MAVTTAASSVIWQRRLTRAGNFGEWASDSGATHHLTSNAAAIVEFIPAVMGWTLCTGSSSWSGGMASCSCSCLLSSLMTSRQLLLWRRSHLFQVKAGRFYR